MINQHEIHVDLLQRGCDPIIQLSQGDVGSHEILFWITKNRRRWRPPAGLSVLVHYSNSFHSGGTYDTLPDGSPAWKLGRDCLSIALVPEMMALPGSVHVVITLLHGGKTLSAFHVQLMVKGLATASSPVLTNYTNITGFLPAPDSAEEGQIFAAESITASGKVASVKAIDADNMGGSIDSDLLPSVKVEAIEEGVQITLSDKDGTTCATVLHGENGISPSIGSNGNWFIGDADTGITAEGTPGPQGEAGPAGPQGETGIQGKAGLDGKSAYEYALQGGYTGTEDAFARKLASEGYGYVAQPEPPEDKNLLWLDTDDHSSNSAESVQADWNAPEGEAGHVRNRTHYSQKKVFYENMAFMTNASFYETDCVLEYGKEYTVIWNSVQYTCIGKVNMGIAFIGNMALVGGEDTGEPFCIITQDGMIAGVGIPADEETNTASVTIIAEIDVKIPKKYLPDSMNSYIIRVSQEEWDTWDSSENVVTMTQNWNDFAGILYAGGDVWLDLSGIVDDQKWYTPGYAKVLSWAIGPDGNSLAGGIIYAYINNGYRFTTYTFIFPGSNTETTA